MITVISVSQAAAVGFTCHFIPRHLNVRDACGQLMCTAWRLPEVQQMKSKTGHTAPAFFASASRKPSKQAPQRCHPSMSELARWGPSCADPCGVERC